MDISATIDTSRAEAALLSLREAMIGKGMDAVNLLRDEAKLLTRTIVNFVPPPRAAGNPRQIGEHAVEVSLKNLISEATPNLIDEVGSKIGPHDITTAWLTETDKQRLNLQWANLDPNGTRLPELHKSYRDARTGRTASEKPVNGVWKARIIVPLGARAPYIAKVKARVGRMKATWALIGSKLGDSFPQWISRHFGSASQYSVADITHLNDVEKPYIIFGSRAPGNNRLRPAIRDALRFRIRAMAKKTKLILSNYSKAVASGIKAEAAAHKIAREQPEVVQ
jgi:hypothetical protein